MDQSVIAIKWIVTILILGDYITTINGLTLISSGPLTNESTITLCANSIRYLIFMECSVEKSNNMFWKLNPIFNSVSYNADSREGLEILRSHIKLTLTKKEGETEQISFTSQFQAFSDELYDTIERYGVVLKVSCGTAGRESKEIRIEAQGDYQPQISGVSVEKENEEDRLRVAWSISINVIVNIEVIAENIGHGIKNITIVEGHRRETVLLVDPTLSYNISVVAYTICKENFTSNVYEYIQPDTVNPTPPLNDSDEPPACKVGTTYGSLLEAVIVLACFIGFFLLIIFALTIVVIILCYKKYHVNPSGQANPTAI